MAVPCVHQGSSAGWQTPVIFLRAWLVLVIALVFAMVVVGGATRLTDSGLSITEWQPILGAIPPLTEADWQDAFSKYMQIPEYHLINKGMSLGEFKLIFWWEWAHRFLGRFIGVAFALPLLFFLAKGWLSRRLASRFAGVLLLGAVQGLVGWCMVKSGLVDRVDVSQYRLALHLTVAITILGLLIWLLLDLGAAPQLVTATVPAAARVLAIGLLAVIVLQIVLGAFVAGLKAGLTYNTWPLMDGKFIPVGLGSMSPWYENLFENITTVQFNHRMVAYIVCLVAAANAIVVAILPVEGGARRLALLLVAAVFAQAALGILTLLFVVPLPLGLAHQAGAACVFAIGVWYTHRIIRGGVALQGSAA
jgi:cytochrome c oxidase assembly protein subunit 15